MSMERWVSVWMRDRSVCPRRDGTLFKSHFDPQNPIKKLYEVAPICNPNTPTVAVGDLAWGTKHVIRNKRDCLNNVREEKIPKVILSK